jgi:hypothetical protein
MNFSQRFLRPLAAVLLLLVTTSIATVGAVATPPAPPSKHEQAALTPGQALERLMAGNARFAAGQTGARAWPALRARTAEGQHPFGVATGKVHLVEN